MSLGIKAYLTMLFSQLVMALVVVFIFHLMDVDL